MYSKTPPSKRPREGSSVEWQRKILFKVVKVEDNAPEEKLFQFRILLPNATTIELKMRELRSEIPIEEFRDVVSREYRIIVKQRMSQEPNRKINWKYQDLYFSDAHGNKLRLKVNLKDFKPGKWHFLWLHDGSAEPDVYEGMWDLTPDTDLLTELPDDYTFETALADLIDNSLQALWSNGKRDRRLISVDLHPNKISIFDSGPGMDGTDGNLVKWGKMGASLHRSEREKAIGGEPPYLMPFFGMFGYGGPVATMCLGRRAVVSSKTKNCKKVFTLHLERDALVSASSSENCWRTKGGMRDPSQDEKEDSPHGSFTKVEIFEPKVKTPDIKRFRYKLKDIYFPYIQCDEMSGKTSTPVEFQVNGIDLAGIQGGEVATTNLHSCHGPDFILQLHFSINQDSPSMSSQNQGMLLEANARLKCVYFPTAAGEESIQKILDKLDANGCGIRESFETFSRVSLRRLGRLLPDTRWALLPFMEPKQKKGEKGHSLKRHCCRVKCFIDTDAGFNPTPHKTDLAQHHPYTKALKNFGNRAPENEKEVQVQILREGKELALTELEKQYIYWISEMHQRYDEEIGGGLDEPIYVVGSSKMKKLDLTADVLRVYKKIRWKGKYWTAGQNIKVLKGACAGCHKRNVFATLEYIIFEERPGDTCGEARLICRPLGLPEDRGCHILVGNDNNTIDIRNSLALPIRVIDSEKCTHVDDVEWGTKLEAHNQKLPASIDVLSNIDCKNLEIEGGLPTLVQAGDAPPENIVAVIRPMLVNVESSSNRLDQKFIVRDDLAMSLEIKCQASDESGGEFAFNYSAMLSPSSQKGLHGLYVLPLRMKKPDLFQKAGFVAFSFFVKEPRDIRLEQVVEVRASAERGRWKVIDHNKDELYTVRVSSCSKPLAVACCDEYNNRARFASVPKLTIRLSSRGVYLAEACSMKVDLTPDKLTMRIKELLFKTGRLDGIRPHYEANLNISRADEAFSIDFPCRVIPGTPEKITIHPHKLRKQLIPGQVIEMLALEVFDEYGNHIKEDETISLRVDGFSVQDESGVVRAMGTNFMKKVNAEGFVDLSNTLKVTKGYGRDVLLSVISKEKVIFKMQFQTETRELRSVPKVFRNCQAGSHLENIVFEITDSEGKVDESIHDEEKYGQSHSLTIKSDSFDVDDTVRYSFRNGRCTIRSIPLPQREGVFCFSAVHFVYPELNSVVEVHVENAREENRNSRTNHEDIENLVFSAHTSSGNERTLLHSPPLNISQETHGSFSTRSSRERVSTVSSSQVKRTPRKGNSNPRFEKSIILRSPASASPYLGISTGSASISLKELESGFARNDHGSKLDVLKKSRSQIQKDISDLQASIDRDVRNISGPCDTESILTQIKSKSETAAAVICNIPSESMPQAVVGVVALLGTVDSFGLSRMLAIYLGEDQMLAIVCRNYASAYHLETITIRKFADEFGQTIKSGYHAVCLEDIREKNGDRQQLLHLKAPTMPNGNVPRGFLGYAVKLMRIADSHSQWRTDRGLDLQETLFYRLFGELQVYEDRESMMAAQSCIKHGAVSLDGGIMRGNGLISLGHWESKILFPVRKKPLSPKLQSLERKKLALEQINKMMDEENESKERADERLRASLEKYNYYESRIGSSTAGSSRNRKRLPL